MDDRPTMRFGMDDEGIPDVLTPAQFVDRERRSEQLQPERALMIAVLEDALIVYQRAAHDERPEVQREFHEVRRWFESRDTTLLYSFESICEVLNLDATGVRRALGRWRNTTRRRRRHGWRRVARYRDGVRGPLSPAKTLPDARPIGGAQPRSREHVAHAP